MIRRLRKQTIVISLSGPDGSGKSTIMTMFRGEFIGAGLQVKQIWHRPGYSLAANQFRAAIRRLRPQALPDPSDRIGHDEIFHSGKVRLLWCLLAVTDSALIWAVKVRLHVLAGRVVICDRFVDDGVMDLQLRFGLSPRMSRMISTGLRILAPKPTVSILLTAPSAVLDARLADKVEPFPETIRERAARRAEYALWDRSAYQTIDTSAPIPEIKRIVSRIVETIVMDGSN